MRNNKQARTLGSRLQGAGRKERGAGAGRRVLGGAHKRYLTAGLLPAVLAESGASAVLWVSPPVRTPGETHRWQARCRVCSNEK